MTRENGTSTPVIHFWFWRRPSNDLTVCAGIQTIWCVLQKPWSCQKSPRWHKMTCFFCIQQTSWQINRDNWVQETKRNWVKIIEPILQCLQFLCVCVCAAIYWLICCAITSVFPRSIIVIWTISDNPTLKQHVKTKQTLICCFILLTSRLLKSQTQGFRLQWL